MTTTVFYGSGVFICRFGLGGVESESKFVPRVNIFSPCSRSPANR